MSLYLLLNVGDLSKFFPSWKEILKYQEVLRFAAGLADNARTLFNCIYGSLSTSIVNGISPGEGWQVFLESLWCVAKDMSNVHGRDPFCNEFIIYITKLESTLFIPSQSFVFETPGIGTRDTRCDTDWTYLKKWDSFSAKCVIKVKGNEMLCGVLQVLKTIRQYQQVVVCILSLDCVNSGSDNTRILLDLLKDRRNYDRTKNITDNDLKTKLLLDIIKIKVYDYGDPASESTTKVLRNSLEERRKI